MENTIKEGFSMEEKYISLNDMRYIKNCPDVLSIKELCAMLHVSRKYAYDFIINNNIKYKLVGKKYFISKKSVLEFLEED